MPCDSRGGSVSQMVMACLHYAPYGTPYKVDCCACTQTNNFQYRKINPEIVQYYVLNGMSKDPFILLPFV